MLPYWDNKALPIAYLPNYTIIIKHSLGNWFPLSDVICDEKSKWSEFGKRRIRTRVDRIICYIHEHYSLRHKLLQMQFNTVQQDERDMSVFSFCFDFFFLKQVYSQSTILFLTFYFKFFTQNFTIFFLESQLLYSNFFFFLIAWS